MIPTLFRLKIYKEEKRRNLWIPLLLLYPFLTGFMVILLPIILIVIVVLIVKGVRVLRTSMVLWALFMSIHGLRIDVESDDSRVFISID